jgi:branched-chain amino acid aminotransferase
LPRDAYVLIGGRVVRGDRARVSVFDRGFLYGDSVYEVLRCYSGAPFALAEHHRRLVESARRIGFELPFDAAALSRALSRVLRVAGLDGPASPDAYVRVIVTRGGGPLGLDPALAERPMLVVIALPAHAPPPSAYERGVSIALVDESAHPRGVDPRVKSGNYLASVTAMARARAAGAHEALRVDRRGRITEGASSNLFVVMGRTLRTPPLSAGILEGVTRAHVIALARGQSLRVVERAPTVAELARADEAFVTSSIREIVPVVRVFDRRAGHPETRRGIVVGDGAPGPVTRALLSAFRAEACAEAERVWAMRTRRARSRFDSAPRALARPRSRRD